MAKKTINAKALQEVVLAKTIESVSAEPKESTKKSSKKTTSKKAEDQKIKSQAIKETKSQAKTTLVEEVVSNREVKYLYPEDCNDPLSRKKFRQKVRNELRNLELEMLRIENKTSKEFKAKEKEYNECHAKYLKKGATA